MATASRKTASKSKKAGGAPSAAAPKRVRRPEEVKGRILKAALEEFANVGFDGASTRNIAAAANVSISLLVYHFRTKEDLWKAVFDDIFKGSTASVIREEHLEEKSAVEKLRVMIDHIVHLFALNPGLHRLMTHEGHVLTDRLIWMCDTHMKDELNNFCDLIRAGQAEGKVQMVDPIRLRFAVIALAAIPFSMSAEYKYLTGRNPFSPSEIRNAIEFIDRLVFK